MGMTSSDRMATIFGTAISSQRFLIFENSNEFFLTACNWVVVWKKNEKNYTQLIKTAVKVQLIQCCSFENEFRLK